MTNFETKTIFLAMLSKFNIIGLTELFGKRSHIIKGGETISGNTSSWAYNKKLAKQSGLIGREYAHANS